MSGYLALLILVPIAVLVIVLLAIECRLERKREAEDGDDRSLTSRRASRGRLPGDRGSARFGLVKRISGPARSGRALAAGSLAPHTFRSCSPRGPH